MNTNTRNETEFLSIPSLMGPLPTLLASFSICSTLSYSLVLPDHLWLLARAAGSCHLSAAHIASSAFLAQVLNSFPFSWSPFKDFPKPPAHTLSLLPPPQDPHSPLFPYCSQLPFTKGPWLGVMAYSPLEPLWPGKGLAQRTLLSVRNDQPTQTWAREVPRLRECWGSAPLMLWKEWGSFLWPLAPGGMCDYRVLVTCRSLLPGLPAGQSCFSCQCSNVTASWFAGTQNSPSSRLTLPSRPEYCSIWWLPDLGRGWKPILGITPSTSATDSSNPPQSRCW